MRTGRRSGLRRRLPVAALTLALLAGCTGPSGPTPGGPVPTGAPAGAGTVGARATTTPAAELRAALTALLVERALLGRSPGSTLTLGETARVDRELVRLLAPADAPPPGRALSQALAEALAADRATGSPATAAALAEVLSRLAPRLRTAVLAESLHGEDAVVRAVQAAAVLANAVAAERGLGASTTPAVDLRASLTDVLVRRAWALGGPERTGVSFALAVVLVPDPGVARTAVRRALAAEDRALAAPGATPETLRAAQTAVAAAVARAVPALPAPVLLPELQEGRARLLDAARRPQDLTLRARTVPDAVRLAGMLAAGAAEQQHLS